MSAVAAPALAVPLRAPRPPLARLVLVELRKMVDTRAGRWLLGILALIVVATTVILVIVGDAGDDAGVTFVNVLRIIQIPVSVLLPVLAILSVTSEWSQRTALTTFTLVPVRGRVILAKALAVVALNTATIALSAVLAAIAAPLGDGWDLELAVFGETFVFQLMGLLGGFAFGLAFQSSAPAIVLYYVVPTIVSVLIELIRALEGVAEWLDAGQTTEPLLDTGASAGDWARIGTSAAFWILIPLAIGLWRLNRTEVKSS